MRGSCPGPVRRRRGRAPALGVSRASVPTVPSVGRAPQRADLLAQPREHLAHEPEHQEHQPGESEQQHQIEKRPVALLEHETLDQRVDGDQEAEEDQHGPGHAEEQHRLAPEAELEPHGEKVQYPDGNATDPELRLPRPARQERHWPLGEAEALGRGDHHHEAMPVGRGGRAVHPSPPIRLDRVQIGDPDAEQPAAQPVVHPRDEPFLVVALLRAGDHVGRVVEDGLHEVGNVARAILQVGGIEDEHPAAGGVGAGREGRAGGEAHSRLRMRAGRMLSWSRYFATVRRAILTPFCANISTICWSVSGFLGSSSATIFWICARMARALASSPVVVERPLEKKNLSGRRPRGVCTYFSFVTRLTVLSCMLMTSATSRRVSGFRYSTPFSKNSRCRSTMKFMTLSIVWRRCSIAWIIQCALFMRWLMKSLFSPWNFFLSRAMS